LRNTPTDQKTNVEFKSRIRKWHQDLDSTELWLLVDSY